MKIEIHSSNPTALWNKIKKDIEEKKVKTWDIITSTQEQLITHNPPQWINEAVLKASTATNPIRLILTVTWLSTRKEPTEYIKALYVGRFTEVLLEHYRKDFTKLETYA